MTFNLEERLAFFTNYIHEEHVRARKIYTNQRSRRFYYENKEKEMERLTKWKLDNPEKVKEQQRRAAKKRKRNNEYYRNYYHKNKAKLRAQQKIWRDKNKPILSIKKKMQREYVKVMPKDPTICKHCGLQIGSSKAAKDQHNFDYHSY